MEEREIVNLAIIEKVQKDYPENSKQAIMFAINLARLDENDRWVELLGKIEENSKQ